MNIIQKITAVSALAMGMVLPVSSMAQTTMDRSKMDMSQPAISMTEGEVKKVDIDVGKVTIKHGPIKHMDMVAHLKQTYAMGHGHANALVAYFRQQQGL